ncbi:O-antigen ligase family protein [Rhodophyticola sp. CCM32]|uniref:O-antigen ligase family protein n=1 Tax=Rhodophyticola sp. CCM32 TaxID=2916397 RepID=UPI00143DBFD9|nr:O-antigen ligase family protein [Rhodophyticola sp. CCM32]
MSGLMTGKQRPIQTLMTKRGAPVLLLQWLLMPLLGKFTTLAFLVLVPLLRMQQGPYLRELRHFLFISLAYVIYITARSLIAGADAASPIGDTLPLIIVAGLAFWAVREPVRLDMGWLFRGTVLMLMLVFGLALFARVYMDVWRPELLLGNPLNLTPLLLVPCMLVTMARFAPSQLWVWLGLLSFVLGGYVIGGLSQSRGLFLGLGVLVLIRIGFDATSPASLRDKIWTCGAIFAAMGLVILFVSANATSSGRYAAAAQMLTSSSPSSSSLASELVGGDGDWSTGLRMIMLHEGWATFLEQPLFGFGPQNRFDAVFPDTSSFPIRLSHLHNDFLTHGVGGGIVAVLLLVLLLVAPAWAGFRGNAGLGAGLAHARREIGVLTSAAFLGVAMVNNVFFVAISAFTTSLSLVSILVVLAALRIS